MKTINFTTETGVSLRGYKVNDPSLNDKCFIIESEAARNILTDHFLISSPLVEMSRAAVKDCLIFFLSILNKPIKFVQMADVVPLSGSLTYDVYNAFYECFKKPLQRNFIGIKRFQKPTGAWETEVSYTNFEGLSEEIKLIFIGDTIATGSTMTQVIRLIQAHISAPLTFVVISIAGTLSGARRLIELENSLQKLFPKTEIWCLFTEAYLGLAPNGTDMPILHHDTICTNLLYEKAEINLGSYLGANLCSVLDWGKRTNSPTKHLLELLENLEKLREINREDKILKKMINKCNEMISSLSS